ncbi:tetratricopeptide repeat protein [Algibacillus agarilyticus]|uniref:tetratricopeptide repeat protein n=1 Tax=Algibacillus agarilyticus TaxID=2234133 RepID=UPI000DD0A6FD|nr:sel1 repeat family protein [Algibacillus agarilyticus]
MQVEWITLEQATDITGASQAIILDTINRYKPDHNINSIMPLTKTEQDLVYFDKNQLISLFPNSSNPVEKEKIPGTVFKWFDELRRAYEVSMQTMLRRVEKVKDDHTSDIQQHYQDRLLQAKQQYADHIDDIKAAHKEQLLALSHHIEKLEKDSDFYQQQMLAQQNTLAQLNNRYDTVVLALRDKENPIERDITPVAKNLDQPQSTPLTSERHKVNNTANTDVPEKLDFDQLVKQAYQYREENKFTKATELFEQAAINGNSKAMGALGRAYFIGEGTEINIETAIAWLQLAAENGLKPAASKVKQMEEKYTEQFEHGIALAKTLAIQIKINTDEAYIES